MRRRVLVVDDEPSILRSTELVLEGFGWDVRLLDQADLIVPTALRERPHVLLLDVRMPGLDLDQVMAGLWREPELRALRVVLYTATLEAPIVAKRLGVPVVEKPCRPEELERALATVPFDVRPNTAFPGAWS